MAVTVEEDVGRFEISMDELSTVEELDGSDDLVDDEPVVDVLEDLLTELRRLYPMALWRSASMYSNTKYKSLSFSARMTLWSLMRLGWSSSWRKTISRKVL